MKNTFKAVYGSSVTTTPWERPNLIRLGQWWNDMLTHPSINDYEFYLTGNFAEKIFGISELPTWDVDVVVIGDVKSPFKLRRLLNDGVQLGFNNKLMVDITWQNRLWDITEWELPQYKIRPSLSFTKIVNHKEERIDFEYDKMVQIMDDFVIGEFINPAKSWSKAHQRYLDGHYLGISENLKKMFK
jgi:hypothetical protein